jgi:hypothetical protein
MSPADAAAVQLEEPDWRTRFHELIDEQPAAFPHYLARDNAFELLLREWRRFHGQPVFVREKDGQMVKKTQPAPARAGVIYLAGRGIMPPRFITSDQPDGEITQHQHDDHCWLTVRQEAWAIRAIEDKMLHLWRGWEPHLEYLDIDLSRARWDKYTEAAVAALNLT